MSGNKTNEQLNLADKNTVDILGNEIDTINTNISALNTNVSALDAKIDECKQNIGGRYLLEPVWSPRILEEESYLRSDTFNWYDGKKYKQAYNHLLNDYNASAVVKKDYILYIKKHGDIVDEGSILSNFSENNYAVSDKLIPSSATKDYIITAKIYVTSSSGLSTIFSSFDNNYKVQFGYDRIVIYDRGAQIRGAIAHPLNTWIWVKLIQKENSCNIYSLKDNNYTLETLPNISRWDQDIINIDVGQDWWGNRYIDIGGNNGATPAEYFRGNLDLDGFEIRSDNNVVWVGSKPITYKAAEDGDKIILSTDTETSNNLEEIYSRTGIAWYYILDIENTRFKLPRTQWNFVGLRPNGSVGEYVEESLPNAKGSFYNVQNITTNVATGIFDDSNVKVNYSVGGSTSAKAGTMNASLNNSSSVYKDGASVQQRANQMILYFYAGETKSEVNSRIAEASSTPEYSIIDPIVDVNTAMFKQPATSSDFTDGGILKLEAIGNVVTITMDLELITDFTAGTRNEIFKIKNTKYLPKTSGRFTANGHSSLPCYIDCVLNEDNTEAIFYLVLKSAYTHSDTQRVQSNIVYISHN